MSDKLTTEIPDSDYQSLSNLARQLAKYDDENTYEEILQSLIDGWLENN